MELCTAAVCNIFPYKKLPPLKEVPGKTESSVLIVQVPSDGNVDQKERAWTNVEKIKLDKFLTGWARWIVNYNLGYICATQCRGTTENDDGICDECKLVASDDSFKTAVRWVCGMSFYAVEAIIYLYVWQKLKEAQLPVEDQHETLKKREKYTPRTLLNTDAQRIKATFEDRILFDATQHLERGNYTGCFLSLYRHAAEGQLKGSKTFAELCQVFEDRLR